MSLAWLNSVKRLPVFPLLFTHIFVSSALLVAFVLSVLSVVLWPFSKYAYRRISSLLAYSVICEFSWLCYDWSGLDVQLFGSESTFDKLGKEFCLITLSHRGDLDWVAGYVMGAQFHFMHSIKTLPKKSVLYVPGFGQILWALECPFLSRSFAKDEIAIKNATEVYKNYPFPIQVCIFCEGTRFTQAKYLKGVQYSKDKGLPIFKHHLVPRTKGFALLAHYLKTKGNFPALYDIGFAYPGLNYTPSLFNLLLGKPFTVCCYIRRIPMDEVPSSIEELNTYCYNLYLHKDEAYDYFLKHGTYPVPRYTSSLPSKVVWIQRLNMLFWVILLLVLPPCYGLVFLSWTTILTVAAVTLAIDSVLTLGLMIYAYQPMGVPDSPKKTN